MPRYSLGANPQGSFGFTTDEAIVLSSDDVFFVDCAFMASTCLFLSFYGIYKALRQFTHQ
ncbi:hypothetical protein BofuT4_uP045130.1 [Botrytis cinerea T4]|uniref:Uncharacterized protein n=1 Tax=Botryotinia fuckeliana (strain T4) TaxID=999810 RepID=G2XYF8_BOTF4|nr:hypothetical protein BofuT4_uP045130.1 [Botrytis cinerea T4]